MSASAPIPGGDPAEDDREVLVIDGGAHWRRWWADLWFYRGALLSLARRNFRSRYRQAALGAAWAIIQPAATVAIFSYIFGVRFPVPSGGIVYPVFALASLLVWNLFIKVMSEGAVSLVANQNLITKLYFPRIYLVLAAGASALVDAAVTAVLLAGLMWYYGVVPAATAPLAVLVLAFLLAVTLGVAALLAALNARWRDVQHTLPFLTMFGLFITPVLYDSTIAPERWRWVVALNPLTGILELFRSTLLGTPLPDPRVVMLSLGLGVAVVVAGVWSFRRAEATIVDVV